MVSIYGYLEAQFVLIKYLTKLYIYKTENLQILSKSSEGTII